MNARSAVSVEALNVSRRFGDTIAVRDVSLRVQPGEIHALLGPNGAGKTTLLRILAGLTDPSSGVVRIMGKTLSIAGRETRSLIGLIPSGDRTFYLRLSGLENLIFFARLQGMPVRDAPIRAREVMAQVGLRDAVSLQVGKYSHGMQKRLSIARALLPDPLVLLVDEATHDLDPDGARRVREIIRDAVQRGAAAIWATQRIDEIRGFAEHVTLLSRGDAKFTGTVSQLLAHAAARRYILRLRNGRSSDEALEAVLNRAVSGMGEITAQHQGDQEHYVLILGDGVVIGDAITSLTTAGCRVLSCREERPEIEEAFLRLTGESGA